MNLLESVISSFIISVLGFGGVNYILKKERLIKSRLVELTFIGAILNVAGSLVHELGHALVAEYWGLSVTWGGSIRGQSIATSPPIYEFPPKVQTTVALAGPLVSGMVILVIWLVLKYTKNSDVIVVLTYLLFTQGLGCFGTFLYVFSGDAQNFAQGLSKLTGMPLETIGLLLIVSSIVLVVVVVKRCVKSYEYIRDQKRLI
jgi:hypothetical protein